MANGDSMPQPGPWQQRHEKELVEQRGSEEGDARLNRALRYWFRRDTWTPDEALPLLIGIDPDSLSHGDSHIRYLDGALISVAASMYAHGIERQIESFDDFKALENLKAVPVLLHEMKLVWNSGGHPARNAPAYFIEWAQRKDFKVPWLESARELGLIGIVGNNTLVDLSANGAIAAPATPAHVPGLPAHGEPSIPIVNIDSSNASTTVAPSLSTREIARLFSGLGSWDEGNWKKRLGEVPQWTSQALVQRGARGRGAHEWNPLKLAQCLLDTVEDKDAMRRKLRTLFRDKPALQPWSEAWRAYEGDLDWYRTDKPGR
ncbi:hypothetical protein [Burkholderia pseudomultivorans]|uniref:hypothetical protein n=1 Tax=Burkholderia pseudomultivorans TaxID=1207504 RepID=UPI00188E5039|nr:hypothetical protein [Burkholderia pseudomultivorans]MBF5010269.1 hypothetical protein [Burkholderia pseudomultivorans]